MPIRGDDFRIAFAEIGELRSLIPRSVSVMALTATTTTEVYDSVVNRLSMKDIVLVALPPTRNNITYCVGPKPKLLEFAEQISRTLNLLRRDYPKTIIFCNNYKDCANLYAMLRTILGSSFTEPVGYPDLHKFRLVDMYTRASIPEMKEKILSSFKTLGGKLRLIIATTAFSMGIDCPDIRQIYHYGPPNTIEQYVQETGRAGRDNEQSKAVLLYGPFRFSTKEMKAYGENCLVCRQQLLFQNFILYHHDNIEPPCKCCDICAYVCECDRCS